MAKLKTEEFDAILAGLRLLATALRSGTVSPDDGDIGSILTSAGSHEGLSADGVHDLADNLDILLG